MLQFCYCFVFFRLTASLAFVAAVSAHAQTPALESWADTTATVWRNQRTEFNVNIQNRGYPSRLDTYRVRTGPIVEHRLRPWLSFWGGLYFQHLQSGVDDRATFKNYTRWFGGFNYRVYQRGKMRIDGRTVAERFVGFPGGDFPRFRQRVMVNFEKPVAPYFGNELFSTNTGLLSNRLQGGLRTRISPEFTLMTGLLWENRSFASLPNRYALVLSVIYRKRASSR